MNPFPLPAFTDNYIWLIINEAEGFFDCVDPGDAAPVLQFASDKGLTLRCILLTHHHFDHIGGVSKLLEAFAHCKLYGPEDSRIGKSHQRVSAGETLFLSPYTYRIVFNPGHTSTHISYYEPKQGWLFCGDTLFSGGCGRVFDGTLEELHASLQGFKTLPPHTKVFCAHEYTLQNLRFAQTVEPNNAKIKEHIDTLKTKVCSLPSTLALELSINPFLRTHIPEVKAYALAHGAVSEDSLEVFRILRHQKNAFQS